MAELDRIVRPLLPTVLGAVAMIACVAIEHTLGVYVPSEQTGSGGHLCGLIMVVTTLAVLSWQARHMPPVAIYKTCVLSLLILALVGAAAEAVYFEWVLGGLSEQMETFTRATLEARGVPRVESDEFAESVRASWVGTKTLPNTFALYLVWGGLLGGGVAFAVRTVAHVSKLGRRAPRAAAALGRSKIARPSVAKERPMWQGVRHAVAILVLPVTVIVVVPVWIARSTDTQVKLPEGWFEWAASAAGFPLLIVGAALFLASLLRFGTEGEATLAPWDPPKHLVVRGPYAYVRNPMISGVILLLLAEGLMLRSWPHLGWAGVFVLINAVYLPLLEEPMLRARFGQEYERYSRNVPRLIPRLHAWREP